MTVTDYRLLGTGGWTERWRRLTGVRPDQSLHKTKSLNGIAHTRQAGNTTSVHDDAIKPKSQEFLRRNRNA